MFEGRGDGFKIRTYLGAGMGGGVDRDRHGGRVCGLKGSSFLSLNLERELC